MAEQSGQDKTEVATPRRREEAREKGNVAKSMDLNSVAVLFAGVLGLQYLGSDMLRSMIHFTIETYRSLTVIAVAPEQFHSQFSGVISLFGTMVGPLLIILLLAGLTINVSQTGFLLAKKALIPKFEKINPLKGFQRMFSMRSVVESIKGFIKIIIVGGISFLVLKGHLEDFWILSNLTAEQTLILLGQIFLELAVKIGLALLVLAVADFAYQKYEYEKNLKMTKQEVRDEMKQYEGSAEVKGRIRSAQRQAARNRMMAAVPDATVVVTNPTFIAVAMKYESGVKGAAPTIVAKGKRKLAERIKQIARENGVPIIENKPLARGLHDTCEIGMEIPFVFYSVVAEVLVQVYQMKQNPQSGGLGGAYAR